MRINSNQKVHKMKRDSFKTLTRVTLNLANFIAQGVGVYYLCSVADTKEFVEKRQLVDQANAEGEVEFNARMNELRTNANAFVDPISGEVSAAVLPHWEKELDGKTWRIEDEGKAELENTTIVSMTRSDLLLGGLLLVNQWHSIPADYSYDSLVSVGTASGYKVKVVDSNVRLFQAAFQGLSEAMDDAAKAGLDYYIVREGYRSNEEQTSLFEQKMTALSDKYNGDILIAETKKSVNYPGTSEYQTGFSFRMDLYSKEGPSAYGNVKYSESEQGKWLSTNGWKYGLTFRFPVENFPDSTWESKTYKTGISSRMNLYRYVGKPHAAVMRVMDLCLEEYVEFLMEHPHVTVYEDGALRYEVYRLPASDEETTFSLPVPNPASAFQASLDNMGGVVLAYTY